MTLSILIVNWNSKDHLRRCLLTVRSTCAELSPQIVVVDGGSFDGCGEMLAIDFPEVEFVQSAQNLGFGLSNNLGFERVTEDAVLLLNPDTELKDGSIPQLMLELQRLPAAGILGPRLLNSDGSLQTSCVQALPTPLNQGLDCEFLRRLFPRSTLWGTWDAYSSSNPVEVEAVSGACMLLRSHNFRTLGGFSSEYFMYGEDMDLCAEVRRIGLKVYHIPSAEIVHHSGGSTGGTCSEASAVFLRESVGAFIRKHQGGLAGFAYRLFMAVSSLVRMLLLAVPCALSRAATQKERYCLSLRKWKAILRWSTGGERSPAGSSLAGLK